MEEIEPAPVSQRDLLIVEEESVTTTLRYDKSFTARLIQSDDDTKHWYTDLKNELLSYGNVKDRMSWKRETFKARKEVVAKFAYRGKTLCLFLPLNPVDYSDKNSVEDASKMSCYEDTPLMIRIRSLRREKFAKQMIGIVMEQGRIPRVQHVSVDYYMPYEGIVELINKGLIKRDIKTPQDEAIFKRDNASARIRDDSEEDTFSLEKIAPGIYVTKKD